MFIQYHQPNGNIYHDAVLLGTGYAGFPPYVNDPAAQSIPQKGPLPVGKYTMGAEYVHPRLGRCIPLTPDPSNEMFERADFFIHLENPHHPGFSSEGCIVVPYPLFLAILGSKETLLMVLGTP